MERKLIFTKTINKNAYDKFCNSKKINDYEGGDEYEQNIYYLIKTFFNPIGESDILLDASNEFNISELSWSSVYNGTTIDLVWANTKYKSNNISFLKIFDQDLSNTDLSNYEKEINDFINEVYKLHDDFKQYINNKYKKYDSSKIERLDILERILEKQYEINDELKREGIPEYVWNINKIEFNLYFYFPISSSDIESNKDDLNLLFEKIEKIKKSSPNKSQKVIFKLDHIITEDILTEHFNQNLDNTLLISRDLIDIDDFENKLIFKPKDKRIKNGYVVNISAKSLHKLWESHNNKLLGMNLRLHITNKSVDGELLNSIENEKDLFWFKNNGLVIICSEAKFKKNNKIELFNFSIINGGQTTFSIGNYPIEKDFYLVAKIIILNNFDDVEEIDVDVHNLSTEISLSTNNQKPIKKIDRISSVSECRMLKQKLWKNENRIFLEIRRGDKPINKKIKQWEKMKAETVQQIFYAFYKIKPGSSRNKIDTIFKNENLKESFGYLVEGENYKHLVELSKFWWIVNDNAKSKKIKQLNISDFKNEKLKKLYTDQFITYFKFYSFSALFIFVLMKYRRNEVEKNISILEMELLKDKRKDSEELQKEMFDLWRKLNIKQIFKFKDIEKIQATWNRFIWKHFYPIFFEDIKNKNGEEITSWTNFTKTPDVNFYNVFLNIIRKYDLFKEDLEKVIK